MNEAARHEQVPAASHRLRGQTKALIPRRFIRGRRRPQAAFAMADHRRALSPM
jgi:hypothetical protein